MDDVILVRGEELVSGKYVGWSSVVIYKSVERVECS